MTEQWRPIPGFDGYEASDLGRIRSVDRLIHHRNGRQQFRRGLIRRDEPHPQSDHRLIKLRKDGAAVTCSVHALVMLAFVGPCPEGMEVCHENGTANDNRLVNLRYDTVSANRLDSVRHGTHNMTRKTHCKWGHAFDEANTIYSDRGYRTCATCRRDRGRASRYRAAMQKSAVVATVALTASLTACGGGSDTGSQVGAYRSCERAVETTLKAPSTADFSGYSDSQITVNGDVYSVRGYVDAENSFGAAIRTSWDCQVRDTGDNWDLVDLNVS